MVPAPWLKIRLLLNLVAVKEQSGAFFFFFKVFLLESVVGVFFFFFSPVSIRLVRIPDASLIEAFATAARGVSLLSPLVFFLAAAALHTICHSVRKLNLGVSPKGKMAVFAFDVVHSFPRNLSLKKVLCFSLPPACVSSINAVAVKFFAFFFFLKDSYAGSN